MTLNTVYPSLCLMCPHCFGYLGGQLYAPWPQLKFTFPASLFFRPLLILSWNYLAFTKVKMWRKPSNAMLVISDHPFSGCSGTVSLEMAKSHPSHPISKSIWQGHSDKVGKEREAWGQAGRNGCGARSCIFRILHQVSIYIKDHSGLE